MEKCPWCGFGAHVNAPTICPYVKALEFGSDGLPVKMPSGQGAFVTRVEFLTSADFGKQPEEVTTPDYPRYKPKLAG